MKLLTCWTFMVLGTLHLCFTNDILATATTPKPTPATTSTAAATTTNVSTAWTNATRTSPSDAITTTTASPTRTNVSTTRTNATRTSPSAAPITTTTKAAKATTTEEIIISPIHNFLVNFVPIGNNLIIGLHPPDLVNKTLGLMIKLLDDSVTLASQKHLLDSRCDSGLRAFIHGVAAGVEKHLQILDAWGKPPRGLLHGNVAWIGSHDECVAYGSYYVIELVPPSFVQKRLQNVESPTGPINVRFDVCLPNECTDKDVESIVGAMVSELGLNTTKIEEIEPANSHDSVTIIAISIMLLIGGLTFLAILYDCNTSGRSATVKFDTIKVKDIIDGYETNNVPNGDVDTGGEITRTSSFSDISLQSDDTGTLGKMLLSFSMMRNFNSVVDCACGDDGKEISCINGVRVLSMCYLMLGFIYTSYQPELLENGLDLLQEKYTFFMQPIINSTLTVDTFFLISGILVCYLFLQEHDKNGRLTFKQMLYYFLHRITRLTLLYGFVLVFYLGISPYLLNGPYQMINIEDRENCLSKWWHNLLYFNNLYDTSNMCMAWSWYMSVIMQFHLVAPIILIPLILMKWLGIAVSCLCIILHIAMTAYEEDRLGGNILNSGMFSGSDTTWFSLVYIKPWTRCGPYVIGILLGRLLFKFRKDRRVLNASAIFLCWALSLLLILMSLFLTYSDYHGNADTWNQTELTIFQSLFRITWSVGVGWIIFACGAGYGGVVNSILSLAIWKPLARLTFAAYLIHPLVQALYLYNMQTKLYYSSLTVIFNFGALVPLSYFGALVLAVFVEWPFAQLERLIWTREK